MGMWHSEMWSDEHNTDNKLITADNSRTSGWAQLLISGQLSYPDLNVDDLTPLWIFHISSSVLTENDIE